jgi:hypothetical protein
VGFHVRELLVVCYVLPVVLEKGVEIRNMGVPRQIFIFLCYVSVFQHCYITVVGNVKFVCLLKVGSRLFVGLLSSIASEYQLTGLHLSLLLNGP